MQTLRKLVLLLAMVYFLFLVLVITNLVSVDFLDDQFSHFNRDNFYKVMMLIGAGLLALALAVEQSHAAFLHRRVTQLDKQVNELKAQLYDQKQALSRLTPLPTVAPTASNIPPASAFPGEMK